MTPTIFHIKLQANADQLFQDWIKANPSGYFITGKGLKKSKLHDAHCRHIQGEQWSQATTPKICARTTADLREWWDTKYHSSLQECKDCKPRGLDDKSPEIPSLTEYDARLQKILARSQPALAANHRPPAIKDSIIMQGYPALKPKKKTGDEPLHHDLQPLGRCAQDFWRWSASDLVSNTTRGILAEYIVASALGLVDGIRAEWESYDLLTPAGLKIEVKSASYLQSWFHRKKSHIGFKIGPTKGYDYSTGQYSKESKRQADVYVFALLAHKDKATLDPLNVAQWEFYVMRTSVLDATFPTQGTIGLAGLLKTGVQPVSYDSLSSCIDKCA